MTGTFFYGCFLLAVLAFCMIGAMWVFRVPQPNTGFAARRSVPARARLDARYADGEIDRNEYLKTLGDLSL